MKITKKTYDKPETPVPNPIELMHEFDIKTVSNGFTGSVYNFSKLLYRIMNGNLNRTNEIAFYDPLRIIGNKDPVDVLRIKQESGYLSFEVRREGEVITLSPNSQIPENPRYKMPLINLINSKQLNMMQTYHKSVRMHEADIDIERTNYMRQQRQLEQENTLEFLVKTIVNSSKTGDEIPVKGANKLERLVKERVSGYDIFIPGFSDNPHEEMSSHEVPSLYYQRKDKEGKVMDEIILALVERPQHAHGSKENITYRFKVWKRKDKPETFEKVKERWDKLYDLYGNKKGLMSRFFEACDDITILPQDLLDVRREALERFDDLFSHMIGERVEEGRSVEDKNKRLYGIIKERRTRDFLLSVSTLKHDEVSSLLDYATKKGDIDQQYRGCLNELVKMKGEGIKVYDSLKSRNKSEVIRLISDVAPKDLNVSIYKIFEGIEDKSISGDKILRHEIYGKIEDRLYNLQTETVKRFAKTILNEAKASKDYSEENLRRIVMNYPNFNKVFDTETLEMLITRIRRLKEMMDEQKRN